MKKNVPPPHVTHSRFILATGRAWYRRSCIPLYALVMLVLAGNAFAGPVNYVTLVIENDLDSNGNFTVVEGDKVRVAWEVTGNEDKILGKKDRIQLLDRADDSVVASVTRGKGDAGIAALKVKIEANALLYVRYIVNGSNEIINTISHPAGSDTTPLIAIEKASLNALTVRTHLLEQGMTYQIGDSGPAGGIVFYVTEDGLHGMEAAPDDLPGTPKWGCFGDLLYGADGIILGWGANNTADILRGCSEAGTAAELADAYALNGYIDWYLPSKDELALMRLNIGQESSLGNVGGFGDLFYWSSSEVSDTNAWTLHFTSNSSQGLNKPDASHRARAIRSF